MKRLLLVAAAALTLAGCASVRNVRDQFDTKFENKNPYLKPPFYSKYLNPAASPLDAQIQQTVDALRAQPRNAALHNQLGQLLLQKGFAKDAEVEFERSVDADTHFYPGWYNLGLVRSANGDYGRARYAFNRTIEYKPGHSAALFQLGLLEEAAQHEPEAIDDYAKAFAINHQLLDVRVNPRILDSKLVHLALLKMYATEHARESMQFQPTPSAYKQQNLDAPSTQPAPQDIVVPAPPATDPSRQTPAPQPGQPVPQQPKPATPPVH